MKGDDVLFCTGNNPGEIGSELELTPLESDGDVQASYSVITLET
jgi:hypothetical protein